MWDAPWLSDLLEVPEGATWPRLMSPPHPRAIGSHGLEFERFVEDLDVFGSDHELRWFQRLAARRLFEYDDAGDLVWPEALLTLARQVGKSWFLSDCAMFRIGSGVFGSAQLVTHFGNNLAACAKVQAPARRWAKRRDGWDSRMANDERNVTSPGESKWVVRSHAGVYGDSSDFAMCDEAWNVPEAVVSEGVEATLVERANGQLLLTSTAHRLAKPLMRGRRTEAIDDIAANRVGALLLEWSAGAGDQLDSVETWRRASPHWSKRREETIARAWRRVQSGVTEDPTEPDPVESFKAQWLNIWPGRLQEQPKDDPGEPLFEPGRWESLRVEAPDLGHNEIVFGIEDYFGKGAAAAIVLRLPDERLFIDGLLFPTAWDAVMWVRDYLRFFDRGGATIAVGASLAKDALVQSLPANITPMTSADTPAALARLRDLADTGAVVHDGQVDLSRCSSVTAGSPRPVTARRCGSPRRPARTCCGLQRGRS